MCNSYLQLNGVFIGDPLTDNIADPDGYRFHDVFHLANAAILHWSPVVRALIKHKRKSRPKYDEEQDSGRAIVVEEGLTAWLFTRAKALNYYKDQKRVSLGILKTVQEFRSEEHTSELQSLMRTSYAVFCLKKKTKYNTKQKYKITIINKEIAKINQNEKNMI